jgi:hypothetical protein
MAQLSSISAAIFTNLAMSGSGTATGTAAALSSANISAIVNAASVAARDTALKAYFATATSLRNYSLVSNVRSFPAIGSPANVVNVPVFGQRQSQTVGGQSDAPSLEVTINYIANDWVKEPTTGSPLGNAVGDGSARVWRMALVPADPTVTAGVSLSKYDSAAGGFGTTDNSAFYWIGKLESMLITPSLTDATQATLSFSIQSDFYGPYTY